MYSDWHALGEASVFYRKWPIYEMSWKDQIDQLGKYHICGSQFGGPVAVIQKEKSGNSPNNGKFFIFSSSGVKLSEVIWDDEKNGLGSLNPVGLGWSDQEQLIIVLEDGNVHIFDIHGKFIRNFKYFI